MCAAQQLKRYYDPGDLCAEEWELNDEKIAALDLQGAASPMEVEGELPDMNAEEMAKEGFYLVKSVIQNRYRQGWHFLTLCKGFGVEAGHGGPRGRGEGSQPDAPAMAPGRPARARATHRAPFLVCPSHLPAQRRPTAQGGLGGVPGHRPTEHAPWPQPRPAHSRRS